MDDMKVVSCSVANKLSGNRFDGRLRHKWIHCVKDWLGNGGGAEQVSMYEAKGLVHGFCKSLIA